MRRNVAVDDTIYPNPLLGMSAGPLALARWRSNGVRSVTDGVTTSGSPTITSATANFTVADIGKTVTAPGVTANVVLITPGTTINAVVSATQATLSANAAATTTGTSFMLGARPLRHIVCYGDSVTQGYNIDNLSPSAKRQSWVDDLRGRLGSTGIVHGGWQPVYWNGAGRWASIAAGGWTSDGASASNLGASGQAVSALRRSNASLGSLTWYRPGNMPVTEVTIWWVDDSSSGASFSWKCNASVSSGTDYNTVTCSAPGTPTLRQTVINLSSHPGTFVENFSTIRFRNASGSSATPLASPMILGISVRSSSTKTVTDGVTTNASASITSATATFTQADVGKLIGTTNVTVGTYILSVQSATQATLSANATATSSAQTFNLLAPITGTEVHNFGYSGESLATAIPKAGDWGAMFDALRPELAVIEFSNDCANTTNLANFPARMDTVISRLNPYADLIAFGFPEQDPIGAIRPVVDQDTVRNSTITKIVGSTRSVADGTTATNTTITSATANFTTADLGLWIGGPGIPQNTFITVINSTSSVTVSNATFATASALTLRIGRTGGAINFKTRWGSTATATALGLMEYNATPVHPNAEGDREIAATIHRFLRTFG